MLTISIQSRYSWNGSPPCIKIRALLNYYDKPYKLIEVDLATKEEIKWPGNDYSMVPQVTIGRKLICDSPNIMKHLYPILAGRELTDTEYDIEVNIITNGFMLAYEIDMFVTKEDTEKILAYTFDYYDMTFPYTTMSGKFNGAALPGILSTTIPVRMYSNS